MSARRLLTGLLGVCAAAACSAGGGGKDTHLFGNGGSGNSTGTGSTPGAGSTVGAGSTLGMGSNTFIATGGSNGSGGADSSACPRTVSKPEQITVLVDASYTDTVYTYAPIAIYIMQDRSTSMITFSTAWADSTSAITQFVNDPSSDGLYLGMGAFPPYPGGNAGTCTTECATPIVPIASLPGNRQAIVNGYNAAAPTLFPILNTPTECGLNGMVSACTAFEAAQSIDCVGLLITDGTPTACNQDDNALASILSTAYTNTGMKTFVLGLPGANISRLNTLAAAGQTGTAIDLTGGVSAQKMLDAFNTVRSQVATTVATSSQTTTNVISTKLPCEWGVPVGIQPNMTNLEYIPSPGAPTQQFGHLTIPSGTDPLTACGTANGDAWYYDNEGAPTKIFVCPTTCDKIKAEANPQVDLIFGCETVEIPIR